MSAASPALHPKMKAQVGHSEMTVKGSRLIRLKVNAVKINFFFPEVRLIAESYYPAFKKVRKKRIYQPVRHD